MRRVIPHAMMGQDTAVFCPCINVFLAYIVLYTHTYTTSKPRPAIVSTTALACLQSTTNEPTIYVQWREMSLASVENVAALPSLPSPLKDLTSGLTVATGEEGPKKILEELPYMTYAIFFDTLPLVLIRNGIFTKNGSNLHYMVCYSMTPSPNGVDVIDGSPLA